jgi:ferredoxin-type protein NapH
MSLITWGTIHEIQRINVLSPLAISNGNFLTNILKIAALGGLGIAGVLSVLIWKKNLATKVSYIRLVVQMVSFALFFYLFTFNFAFLYLLIIIFGITLFLGRLYCGWLCPFGFIMDLETIARKALKIRYRRLPERLNRSLHQSRYVILLFFLLLPIALWLGNPPPNLKFAEFSAQLLAGPFLPYGILIAPAMPFVAPWTSGTISVFSLNLTYPYVAEFVVFIGQNIWQFFAVTFVGLMLAGSFLIRRVWCRFCPTGGSLGVVNRFRGLRWAPLLHIEKDGEKCTKCGVCKRVCHLQVTDVYEERTGKSSTSMCMLCLRCVEMCPYENTLKLKFGDKTLFKSRNWLETATIY